jgi:leucyl/phenylalanyl-tRNA--protein transferase
MAFETERMRLPAALRGRTDRRAKLFRESLGGAVERHILGLAWALSPTRIRGLPNVIRLCFDEFLAPDYALPDPERAFDSPSGLAGIVHDLSVPTLLTAYRRGLYPFAHIAPLKWWSPPARSVLFFDELHIARRLRRQMRQDNYTVTLDRDFEAVIAACAGQRDGRWRLTWITPRVMRAFADLFDAGYAHSFEVWNERGELAGGGYGLALGRAFITESQFSREPNTSKMGFTALNWQLAHWGFDFNDGKLMTPTCHGMGFREIPRDEYLRRLTQAERHPEKPGRWQIETDFKMVADWQPA